MLKHRLIAALYVLALAGLLAAGVLPFFLAGCSQALPYIWEHPIEPFNGSWLIDGPGKVFTVVNPTDQRRRVDVECWSQAADGVPPKFSVVVRAHGEWRALGQVMNREQIDSVCRVVGSEVVEDNRPEGM